MDISTGFGRKKPIVARLHDSTRVPNGGFSRSDTIFVLNDAQKEIPNGILGARCGLTDPRMQFNTLTTYRLSIQSYADKCEAVPGNSELQLLDDEGSYTRDAAVICAGWDAVNGIDLARLKLELLPKVAIFAVAARKPLVSTPSLDTLKSYWRLVLRTAILHNHIRLVLQLLGTSFGHFTAPQTIEAFLAVFEEDEFADG